MLKRTCAILGVLLASVLCGQTIQPSGYTAIGLGTTQQLSTQSSGQPDSSVIWSVNGGAANGTITSTGLYTAPAVMNAQQNAVVTATTMMTPATKATKYIYLLAAPPAVTSITPNPLQPGTINIVVTGTGFQNATVSVSFGAYSMIQMSTTSQNSTTIKANTWLSNVSSATFYVRNGSSSYTQGITIPVAASGPPQYSLTVNGGSPSGSYTAGTVVNISANAPAAGQMFSNWTGGVVASPNAANTTITMPASNVVLTANYTAAVATYALTVIGGTNSGLYAAGATVNISANAAALGTVFSNWTGAAVLNANNASTSLVMPAAATTVTANFVALPSPIVSGISVPAVPLGIFNFIVNGSGFIATSQATLGGTALITKYNSANQLTVSGFASTGGSVSLIVTNPGLPSAPFQVQVGPTNPMVTPQAARHFLQQAAFGPSPTDAANVQAIGFQGWLNQQFAQPKVSNYNGLGNQGGMPSRFLNNAVNQPDQLRQRVAFALSQIFTISINKVIWNGDQQVYQEMLMTDAFSNYRQILQDVTLSPGMGDFLDMANNAQANPQGTVLPNENYAREVMQLFTIGTVMLNQDGTKQTDANNPTGIPTYNQANISEFARVYTGWSYPPTDGHTGYFGAYLNSNNGPMVPYSQFHDMGPKNLLQYTPLPGTNPSFSTQQGAGPVSDLQSGLDNIFYHPNVGPFVGKLLIQHLVKSDPSPAYISRVAAVFNNNGLGTRGDMVAVVTAILMDPEARQNDVAMQTQPTDGHLQEPMLFLAGFLRAFGAYVDDTNYYSSDLANMGQDIYNAPSVFNYYSPGYMIPNYGVGGPEFQIYTPYSAVYRANLVAGSNGGGLFSSYSNPIQNYGAGTTVDLTPYLSLTSSPSTLVDALDLTLTCGLAPAGLKQILVLAVQSETGGPLRQVQTAIYLLLSSGYYNVWN
jgi:hypothetical protein